MKKLTAALVLVILFTVSVSAAETKSNPPAKKNQQQAGTSPNAANREQNIQEYIVLLRSDVRQQKTEMMGSVMQLSAEEAAKFWPIYSEYDAELTKLNDLRVANIEEYARTYSHMTDEEANTLIQNAMTYEKQRSELLAKYYGRVKQALGAITAARFVQVEHQLLLIIDLQIASSLPVV
jgi:hypothetical protein